jgi:hypothetical protein
VLPNFNNNGDLPPGIHRASWKDVAERFGSGTEARTKATTTLKHLHDLAARTGCLRHFYVFGSFASRAAEPRDVDVVLIMSADFRVEASARESRTLFSHADAQARYGASVFWVREGMVAAAALRDFLLAFQTRRDGKLGGILEVA